jgi:hypothetical protein
MIKRLHPIAGTLALLLIVCFWLSTVLAELFASEALVTSVKTAIPWGLMFLLPALLLAGVALARGRREGLIGSKFKRMPVIAANGFLVLIPSALFLAFKARTADFGVAFYVVQALELAAGATNIVLLSLNLRDGLRMRSRIRRKAA